ncbi:MAG: squalene synthase HpnC [Acidobacteriota bacterium]|nr:squalene synthase HpnC [Acidobacteriota bacterium]
MPFDEARLARGWAALPPEYAIPATAPSLEEARAYCQRLATSHYENFSVVTWFLPRDLHQHFFNVYAYCRVSDDLGDEVGDTEVSLALLDRWEHELNLTYAALEDPAAGGVRHPVFLALAQTIRACSIPRHEFSDLLTAFRQDQRITRYETFDELLGYCRNSANPVGRLVLYLCGYRDAERQALSDFTCTALQLANFWQDVSVDWKKGRVYLPLEDLRRVGVTEQQIAERRFDDPFRELMRFEVARAREWFARGLPLIAQVNRSLALDIELFSRGGQAILEAIEKQNYNVLAARPSLSRWRKFELAFRALAGRIALGRTG